MHFEASRVDHVNIAKSQQHGPRGSASTLLRNMEKFSSAALAGEAASKRTDLFITPLWWWTPLFNFHLFSRLSGHSETLWPTAVVSYSIGFGDGCFLKGAAFGFDLIQGSSTPRPARHGELELVEVVPPPTKA